MKANQQQGLAASM
uniref:Uncharacterized protein n=1 Tax=Anguilla anguilla TaxID=7936 RepID=A0A0E9SDZ3_ANGAN